MIDRFTAKARESINLAVQAAEELGAPPRMLSRPNDILAIEYLKALRRQCTDRSHILPTSSHLPKQQPRKR